MSLLSAVDPALYTVDRGPADAPVRLRYKGVAGFILEHAQHRLVLDPFVSRTSPWATLTRPLRPDLPLIERHFPHADDVLVGHAHFDHMLDAPALCARTGARLIGSPDVCNVGRAAGLPEAQLRETQGREVIESGPARIIGLPSLHGRIYLGRVSFPGRIPAPPPWPPRLHQLRHGLVLNWWIEVGGVRILHIDSADFLPDELRGLEVDLVCLCAIGRAWRRRYVEEVVELVRPKAILACHWDWFFSPYDAPVRALPFVDLPGFLAEIRAVGVEALLLPPDGELGLGAPRGSAAPA